MNINALQAIELDELQQNDFLSAIETEEQREQLTQRFRVTDLESANWCLRKLQALVASVNETNALADKEVERINAWREKELSGIQKQAEFFEGLLTRYHAECLEENPKAKTISTPYGKLKSTTRKPAPKKTDDETLLQYLKANGEEDYIITKESPAWGEYKKTLRVDGGKVYDQNGQEVPGVEADLGGTTFKVEVSE